MHSPAAASCSESVEGSISLDPGAFTALYNTYAPALYGAIHKILKCTTLSQDALQNTFIKIWLHKESYDSRKASLFTWMLNIARNEAIDVVRSKHYKLFTATTPLHGTEGILIKTSFVFPDYIDLHKLLYSLEPRDRTILELCFFRGFTCEEASKLLNIPCGTIKTRMQRSYKTVKAAMI